MGDAGEALIDAESRIQERIEELARARAERRGDTGVDPATVRQIESLRLARIDLRRQLGATTHVGRQHVLRQAIDELDQRLAGLTAATS